MIDEELPIGLALRKLHPNSQWSMTGESYDGIEWHDSTVSMPSREEVESEARKLKANFPFIKMRVERDKRLADVDWVVIRSIRTGEPIPQEWKDYMQALADMPANNPNARIENRELINVTWPTRPDGKSGEVRKIDRYGVTV